MANPPGAPESPPPPEGGGLVLLWRQMGRTGSLLALGLLGAATLVAWQWTLFVSRQEQGQRFRREAEEATLAFRDRVDDYSLVLSGARGLFAQGHPVTPAGWAAYCQALDLERARPGLQGLGFARRLAPGEGPHLEAAQRRGGLPGFTLWPQPESAGSTITLIHPLTGRNRRALGFDMRSEPTRRAAMDQALLEGEAVLSGKVKLVQEDAEAPQAGVLLYLPVYASGQVPADRSARPAAAVGWLYSPFRMGDFSRATLGGDWPGRRVELFDGPEARPEALLFDSDPEIHREPPFAVSLPVRLHHRTWTLRITSLPAFEAQMDQRTPLLVLVGGGTISLLIVGLLEALLRVQRRALVLAGTMTTALREEQQRITRILDSTAEGIYGLDLDGRCTFVNRAYLQMHRCTAEEVLGRPVHALAHHSHPDGTPFPVEACPIYLALREGRPLRLEGEWFWRMDGTGYWANAVISPILEGGRATGSVVTLEDVTHLRAAEQAKHDFVSVVSHELRTPLTSIRGALSLLASGRLQAQPESSGTLLGVALRNSERLGRLIDDILDFEKLRSGRLPLHREPVGIRDLLTEAQEANLAFGAQRGVMIKCSHHLPEASLFVDRQRMIQVLTNLLSNAVKFSPGQGEVCMEAEVREGQVHLRVVDQGRGIPEAFRDRIFTPFSQAEAHETRSSEGTGLGLSITKALVEDMGGTIAFTSREGVGTTFTLSFPKFDAPPSRG